MISRWRSTHDVAPGATAVVSATSRAATGSGGAPACPTAPQAISIASARTHLPKNAGGSLTCAIVRCCVDLDRIAKNTAIRGRLLVAAAMTQLAGAGAL